MTILLAWSGGGPSMAVAALRHWTGRKLSGWMSWPGALWARPLTCRCQFAHFCSLMGLDA